MEFPLDWLVSCIAMRSQHSANLYKLLTSLIFKPDGLILFHSMKRMQKSCQNDPSPRLTFFSFRPAIPESPQKNAPTFAGPAFWRALPADSVYLRTNSPKSLILPYRSPQAVLYGSQFQYPGSDIARFQSESLPQAQSSKNSIWYLFIHGNLCDYAVFPALYN